MQKKDYLCSRRLCVKVRKTTFQKETKQASTLFNNMKFRNFIILFTVLYSAVCIAQNTPFSSGMSSTSSSMMQTGSAYTPQISPVGAGSPMDMTSTGPSNRRNAFETPGEANQSTESPVGEPYILLIFAAVAAAVVYIKQRKASQQISE